MIKKSTCIIYALLIWGLPTGIILSLFLSVMKFKGGFEIIAPTKEILFKNFFIFIPLFTVFGIILGLYMYNSGKRYTNPHE